MDDKLLFLQSCVRKDISTEDLGYLTKWLFVDFENITNKEFFDKVKQFTEMNFFDRPITIKEILDFYNK